MCEDIKFIGKYQLKKTFNSPEEFNKYYQKHKEEIESKTSNQLNKEYKINGYKITKRNIKIIDGKKQGEIYLKSLTKNNSEENNEKFGRSIESENETKSDDTKCQQMKFDDIENMKREIEELKTKINVLTESYSHIIDVLNSLS